MTLIAMRDQMEQWRKEMDKKSYNLSSMDVFRRLVIKLIGDGEEGKFDSSAESETVEMIEDAYTSLHLVIDSRLKMRDELKAFKKQQNQLIKHVKDKYDYDPEGTFISTYIALGVALGTSMGVVFMSLSGPAFLSIGIGTGIPLGVAIGSSKENAAKKAGKLY